MPQPSSAAGRAGRLRAGVRRIDQADRCHGRVRRAREADERDVGAEQLRRERRIPGDAGDADPLAAGARERGLAEQHVPVGRARIDDAVRGRQEHRRRDQRAGTGLAEPRVGAARRPARPRTGRSRPRPRSPLMIRGRRTRVWASDPSANSVRRDGFESLPFRSFAITSRSWSRRGSVSRNARPRRVIRSSLRPPAERTPTSTRRMPERSVARTVSTHAVPEQRARIAPDPRRRAVGHRPPGRDRREAGDAEARAGVVLGDHHARRLRAAVGDRQLPPAAGGAEHLVVVPEPEEAEVHRRRAVPATRVAADVAAHPGLAVDRASPGIWIGGATVSGLAMNVASGGSVTRVSSVGSVASGHPVVDETSPSRRSPCGVETSSGAPESSRQVPVAGPGPAAQNVSDGVDGAAPRGGAVAVVERGHGERARRVGLRAVRVDRAPADERAAGGRPHRARRRRRGRSRGRVGGQPEARHVARGGRAEVELGGTSSPTTPIARPLPAVRLVRPTITRALSRSRKKTQVTDGQHDALRDQHPGALAEVAEDVRRLDQDHRRMRRRRDRSATDQPRRRGGCRSRRAQGRDERDQRAAHHPRVTDRSRDDAQGPSGRCR